jgi:hypothetical protein
MYRLFTGILPTLFIAVLASCSAHRSSIDDERIQRMVDDRVQRELDSRLAKEAAEREGAKTKESAERDAAEAVQQFYSAYPMLRGKEACVARTAGTLTDPTWQQVGEASLRLCRLNDSWVQVSTSEGKSIFVDSSRIEIRADTQVTFWAAIEVFDAQTDYVISRQLVDCDAKRFSTLQSASLTSGQYKDSHAMPYIAWESPLPGSQGEAVVTATCRFRAAATAPATNDAATPPANRPSAQPVKQEAVERGI